MRFPGFEERWELKKLKEVASKINSGKTPLGGEAIYTVSGVVFIRSQNVNHDRLVLDNPVFIPDEINRGMKNSVVYPNDILLNITGASLGRSCVVPENFTIGNVNQHVCVIRSNNKYNPRFIQPILSSTKGQDVFKSLQTGSGREGLNFESIKNIKIFYPSLNEQNKIANFLSLLDDRMQTQKKIIEDLKKIKSTLTQKIFLRKIKFYDDNNLNWEIKTLGDIAIITMGQSPDSSSYNTNGNGLPLIQGNADIINRKSEPRQFTNQPTKFCDPGDILLTVRAPVGYTAKSHHKAGIGRGVCAIKNNSKSDSEFIYQFLLFFENKWSYIEQGSTFSSVNSSDIKSIKINIPNVEEQNKIGQFLSSLDEKVNVEKALLSQYEIQKKFLLANLFI